MSHDVKNRRYSYIDKTTNLRNTFSFAHPKQILSAVTKYCGDHYGVILSNLYEEPAQQYFRCWGTCVKLAHSVPRSTHRYFVKDLLAPEFLSIRTVVISRFVNFFTSCMKSKCPELSLVATLSGHDKSSTTGINLTKIWNETKLNPWKTSPAMIRSVLHKNEVPTPQIDQWRILFLEKLLIRRTNME